MIRAAIRRCRDTAGMTLIELCVVIGIIGILFGLAVTSLKRAKLAAKLSLPTPLIAVVGVTRRPS
jgi:prepilin-type N-terminal cleavage/methylation domain-containing protein